MFCLNFSFVAKFVFYAERAKMFFSYCSFNKILQVFSENSTHVFHNLLIIFKGQGYLLTCFCVFFVVLFVALVFVDLIFLFNYFSCSIEIISKKNIFINIKSTPSKCVSILFFLFNLGHFIAVFIAKET